MSKELEDIGQVSWQQAQEMGLNAIGYSLQPRMLYGHASIPVENSRKGIKGEISFDRDFVLQKFIYLLDQLEVTEVEDLDKLLKDVKERRLNTLTEAREKAKQEIAAYLSDKLQKTGLTLEDLNLDDLNR